MVVTDSPEAWAEALQGDYFAALAQYPASSERIDDLRADVVTVHARQPPSSAAADLLALTLITPPGEWEADIVVGGTQRWHADGRGWRMRRLWPAATRSNARCRGRLVGVSIDAHGNPAYRLALQTREQHIRREKATSNIAPRGCCPPWWLTRTRSMRRRTPAHGAARRQLYSHLGARLAAIGRAVRPQSCFDTLYLATGDTTESIAASAVRAGVNLRNHSNTALGIALDETPPAPTSCGCGRFLRLPASRCQRLTRLSTA